MRSLSRLPAVLLLAACTAGDAGTDSVAADSASVAPTAGGDPTVAAASGALPAGYEASTDPGRDGSLSGASYTMADGRWEVRTGPAHIVYAAGDSAAGAYTATATLELASMPEHAEAFGLIVGGTQLDQPTQRYTYFVVRHTGEYLVRVRDGADTRDVAGWTASPAVPQGAAGTSYRLAAQVMADSVRFSVNDQPVTTVARGDLPVDGVAGHRINHMLHLRVTPVQVTR